MIVLYSPRVWDSTWGQEKNLVEELAKQHQIVIIDLIDYGMRYASRFQGQQYPIPENVAIIKRQTTLQAGILFGIYTELKNLWDFLKVKHRGSGRIVMTYLTSGVILTVLLAKCLGQKVILIYGDDYAEFFRSKSPLVAWFTEHIGTPLVSKLSDHIIATAHKLKEDIASFNSNITIIPNGVHVQKLQTYHPESQDLDASKAHFTVGFVGGFGSWVDFEMVLHVAESLPEIQFKLIGSGEQFDEVYSKAQTLSNVWVPGILPYDDVLNELSTMDVCLIPFKINRITDRVSPIKLFEYWAMKKPVICTRFYEVQKIADGRVLFVDNSEDLKNTILHLKDHPDMRGEIAERGFQEASQYDWTLLGAQYLSIIDAL